MGPNAAASPGWPVRPSRVVSGMVKLIAAAGGGPVPARPEGPAGAGSAAGASALAGSVLADSVAAGSALGVSGLAGWGAVGRESWPSRASR